MLQQEGFNRHRSMVSMIAIKVNHRSEGLAMVCQQDESINAAAQEQATYQVLPDGLPLVNEATDALGAFLLLGCQLAQSHRGFGPFPLLGLCLLSLHES